MSRLQRSGLCHVSAAWAPVLPDSANGSCGPARRVVEAAWFRRLGSPTGLRHTTFLHVRCHVDQERMRKQETSAASLPDEAKVVVVIPRLMPKCALPDDQFTTMVWIQLLVWCRAGAGSNKLTCDLI